MPSLVQQRCFNHASREAAARCPQCKQFFCRECITEHDDRVLCTACLKKITDKPRAKHFAFAKLFQLAQCIFGVLLVWFFFFLIGESLLRMPDSFHEGTLWQAHWIDKE